MVKKAIAAVFTVLVLSSALTGCNTTRGVGQDISDGGDAISGLGIVECINCMK